VLLSAAACERPPAAPTGVVAIPVEAPTASPSASATASAAATAPAGGPVSILPSSGLPELPVGKATRKDCEAQWGAPKDVVKHSTYSTTLHFAGGIAATFCQGDPQQTIIELRFTAPFDGYVEGPDGKGSVVLGKTTMRQARSILGECYWRAARGSKTWSCAYQRLDTELVLDVERDLSLPQFPMDEARGRATVRRHRDRPARAVEVAIATGSDDAPRYDHRAPANLTSRYLQTDSPPLASPRAHCRPPAQSIDAWQTTCSGILV